MPLSRSKSERASLLLEAASGLQSAEERREFLDAACADEPSLARELTETLTIVDEVEAASDETPIALPSPGQLLGERFHIMRRLGEGGMAVVFEAVDTKLMERRALKFPRQRYSMRFPEEVRAALRITHENICRIHEIHSTPESDFLSMELIEGETLARRIERAPVEGEELLDVARQLCRGIDAAHSAGILHQDLKPGNVMLTKRAGGGERVVITDFGLAGPLGAAVSAKLAGTPNYIAPERWKGEPATAASDVYALGVILYELVAGRLPFPNGTTWQERLNRRPAAPRAGRWDRIVLRCLEPDPARRYRSAGEVLAAIERAFAPLYRRRSVIAAALALLVAAPVVAFRDRIWPPPVARLAILPLAGSTGDAQVDGAARGALYDVARQLESLGAKSQRMLVIPVQEAARYEVADAPHAAARLGATHVLSASVAPRAGGFHLRSVVTDALTGMTLRDVDGDFTSTDASALAASLAGVVTSAFQMKKAPAVEVAPAAYAAYAAGLSDVEAGSAKRDSAIAHFQEAAKIDGSSALIFAKLADAQLRSFSEKHGAEALEAARQAAQRARALQPDSPEVLLAVGTLKQTEGRTEEAIELFRRAASLDPHNPEAWRRAGLAMQRAGRDREAIELLQQSVRVAPDYFRGHLSLGFAFFRAGRPAEAAEHFRDVTRLAPAQPDGYSNLGAALVAIDRDAEAEAAFRKALDIRETRPTLNNLGVLLRYHGRNREAVGVFERALRNGADDVNTRLNLANALRACGDSAGAEIHLRRSASLTSSELRLNPADAVARAQLAYALARTDRGSVAGDEALQAARLAPTDSLVLFWSIMTLEALGRRDDAYSLLASAPGAQLRDLRRQPDLAAFTRDERFTALVARSKANDERKK